MEDLIMPLIMALKLVQWTGTENGTFDWLN